MMLTRGRNQKYEAEANAILLKWLRGDAAANMHISADAMDAAVASIKSCAASGSAAAHFLLGAELAGRSLSKLERKKQRDHFEASASGGIAIGYLGVAGVAFEDNDPRAANHALQLLNKADARFTPEVIGLLFRNGTVLPKSSALAKPWLELAATRDNSAVAQHELVEMYSMGDGVEKNESQLRKWRDLLTKDPEGKRDWEAEREILDPARSGSQPR